LVKRIKFMKKHRQNSMKKLALHSETLRLLDRQTLWRAKGGASEASVCNFADPRAECSGQIDCTATFVAACTSNAVNC
jgi:hypothetical protein